MASSTRWVRPLLSLQSTISSKLVTLIPKNYHQNKLLTTFHSPQLIHRKFITLTAASTPSTSTTSTPAMPSSSTSKRSKLKKPRVSPDDLNLFDGEGVCAAYCVHNSISLKKSCKYIKNTTFKSHKKNVRIQYTINKQDINIISNDVIYIPFNNENENEVNHVFLFQSGALVIWGLPLNIRKQLYEIVSKFQESNESSIKKLNINDFEHEFNYKLKETTKITKFENDEIILSSNIEEELLSISYGLAQSVRLLIYEEVIDSLVNRTKILPDQLAKNGYINLSHKDLKRLIGELLRARYSINLISDILDTPEYFWSQHQDLQKLHYQCCEHVELSTRAKILNTRTQVINDSLAILNNELSSSSSDRVERAILFLIGVEVVIEVGKAML